MPETRVDLPADDAAPEHDDALPVGERLGEFEILRVLGVGGFGIVYLAMDHGLEREVALKEYLPSALARRGGDGMVSVRSRANAETYQLGMRSFINEARLLARFDHPSLVKVYRFWEDNGTAYMVMPYYRGRTVKQLRATMSDDAPSEAWLQSLLDALLGALEALHAEGVYHRDVAPDNILVCDDAPPVLLDFGAARRVIGDRTQSFTAILKPNFAPIEQYADVTTMRQGPWTDLYALAATIYHLLSGQSPMPAAARMLQDDMPRLADMALPGYSPHFLQALDWALAVRPQDRPQTVSMLRDALVGDITVPVHARRDITRPNVAPLDVAPGAAWATTTVHASAPAAAVPRAAVVATPPAAAPAPDGPAAVAKPPPAAPTPQASRPGRRGGLWGAAAVLVLVLMAVLWLRGRPVPAGEAPRAAAAPPAATWITEEAPAASMAAPTALAAASRPTRSAARAVAARGAAAENTATGPREACGARRFIALLLCMQQQCDTPRFHEHAQCVRMREEEQARRERIAP